MIINSEHNDIKYWGAVVVVIVW